MVGSVGSAGSGLIAAALKEATTAQDVGIAVIKKSQDVEKANGAAALELVASAAPAASSGGIDVYV